MMVGAKVVVAFPWWCVTAALLLGFLQVPAEAG